jgi:hypothetical protein
MDLSKKTHPVLPILSAANWLKNESDTSLTNVDLQLPAKFTVH